MSKELCYSLMLTIVVAGISSAQTRPSSHVSIQSLPFGNGLAREWLQQAVSKLDQAKLRPLVAGSWESQLVEADRQSANVMLRRDLRITAGFYTFTANGVDTLVARWNIANPNDPEKAIWLWDTPAATFFVLQIDPALLMSSEFVQYCENLLIWDKSPVKLTSLQLYYPPPTGAEQRVIGRGAHLEQEIGLFQWWLQGLLSHGEGYVAVGASKPFFEHPREALVPERFPPLKDRLKSFPRNTLFDELGKGHDGLYVTNYPSKRDTILLTELLSRGPLADVEVYQVIIGPFDRRDYQSGLIVNQRLLSFLRVAEERKELSSYTPALERLCIQTKRDGGLQEYAVGNLFGAMARNRIDFSRVALAFVERDQFTRFSLYYLKSYACGEKTAQALSALAVKPEFANYKQDALRQMRARCK